MAASAKGVPFQLSGEVPFVLAVDTWVAARLGASRPLLLAMIVGVLSLVGGIMAMMSITAGPDWLKVELPLYLVVAWLAGRMEVKRRASKGA